MSQDPASFPYELYDLTKDWTQFENVAGRYPAKVKELNHLFWIEANKYQVLPLDATVATRLAQPKPNLAAGRTEFAWSGEVTGTRMAMRLQSSTRLTTTRQRSSFPVLVNLGLEDSRATG